MQRSKFKVRSHPFTLVCTVVFLHSKQSFFSLLLKQELLEAYDEEHFAILAHSAVSYYSHSYNYLVVAVVVAEAEK